MSEKHLQCTAHKIRSMNTAWWYEENTGLCLVVQPSAQHTILTIPWRAIRGAVQRKDRQ